MFCKDKDIFGKPGQGAHSYRLFDIAIVDVLATVLVAFVIWKFVLPAYNFFIVLGALFALGILAHRLFCVRTTVDKLLFSTAL